MSTYNLFTANNSTHLKIKLHSDHISSRLNNINYDYTSVAANMYSITDNLSLKKRELKLLMHMTERIQ